MGTPDFAATSLEKLCDEGFSICGVVTNPDRPKNRGMKFTESEVKKVAVERGLMIFQPEKVKNNDEFTEVISNLKPDLICVIAYGKILPKEILDIPEFGCINVHASLLPKYRGGAPIHKALINGEKETGITIMYMDEGMDTGDIIQKEVYQIQPDDNVGTLHDKLSTMGANLLKEVLPSIIAKTNKREKQKEEEATYAYNIKREEEHLDFSKTGNELQNQIRGLNPWPTAHFILFDSEIKILEAKFKEETIKEVGIIKDITKDAIGITCQDGILYVTKIKPFGKKIMPTKDYLNGIDKAKLQNQKVK